MLGFVIANAEYILLDFVHIYVHVVSYGPNGAVSIRLIIKDLLHLFLISIYMYMMQPVKHLVLIFFHDMN